MDKNNYFFQRSELLKLGFSYVGKDCKISKKISIYGAKGKIGNRVRIDDDVIIKGKVIIGNNVHIARGCTLSGGEEGIYIDDFSAVSNFVQFFTGSDNYMYPAIPSATLSKNLQKKYCKIYLAKILIGKSVLIGTMSTILPGADIGDFSSVGAYSIIYKKIEEGFYYSNNNKIVKKKRNLLKIKSLYRKIVRELN